MRELLEQAVNEELLSMIISNPVQGGVTKVKIRPVLLQEKLKFQITEYQGTQVFHKNLEREETCRYVEQQMATTFRQCQIETATKRASILVSKKGKVTISTKQKKQEEKQNINTGTDQTARLSHNRKKQYLLPEGQPVPFLVDLGVMTAQGQIIHARYDKYRQINRFLEFIQDIVPELDRGRELTILDFGCGKSYLTFAVYYYLHEIQRLPIRIIGLDLKEDVIRHCNELAEKYSYEKLQFLQGDIAQYQGVSQVDLVITLHACDTATDLALHKAVGWKAKVILSVPCCQHEINKQIKSEFLEPITKYGILKERLSAIITDGLRCNYLEQQGYETQILEFIDMEHTPKNLLIRAVFRGNAAARQEGEEAAVTRLLEELQIHPSIFRE